jgi:DNA-binding MarR family transcriptional regulator
MNRQVAQEAKEILYEGRLIWERILRAQKDDLSKLIMDEKYAHLTLAQLKMLLFIHRESEITVSKLSKLLNTKPPSVSSMADRLVKNRLLERRYGITDRRKVILQLSIKAQKDIEFVEITALNSFVKLLEKLKPITLQKWKDALREVKNIQEAEIGI